MSERGKPPLGVPIAQHLQLELPAERREQLWAGVRARRELAGSQVAAQREGGELPLPVADALLHTDELALARGRLWRQVQGRVRRPSRKPSALRWSAASVCVLAAATCLWLFFPQLLPGPLRAQPAALARVDGLPMGVLEASSAPERVRLSDHSEIRLQPGARLKPLLSSGSRFELLLSRGSAEFSVTPGGPRRWLVEAGAARIEVVGTVFRVDRRADGVAVSVSRGAVMVRGENVPGWTQRITAGQRIDVPAHKPSALLPKPTDLSAARPEGAAAPLQPASGDDLPAGSALGGSLAPAESAGHEPAAPTAMSRQAGPTSLAARPAAASRGKPVALSLATPHTSYAALGPRGMVRETQAAHSIETLLQLADVARLSGHPQEAVVPLTRALEGFADSPQAGLAAFTLGRVLLDQLARPEQAAAAFERAVTLRLPGALLANCYRRLAEAYERAGNTEGQARALQRLQDTSDLTRAPQTGGADSQHGRE